MSFDFDEPADPEPLPQDGVPSRLRTAAAAVGRHRGLVMTTLALLLALTAVATYLQPALYEARVKLLVRSDRVDSPVTPTRDVPASAPNVSEEELLSEVQILTSRDLLEQVTDRCRVVPSAGLAGIAAFVKGSDTGLSKEQRTEAAVRHLTRWLDVQLVKKSYVLAASYEDPDAERARCVLDALSAGYLEKRMALRRPAGAFAFFQQETSEFRDELARLKTQMGAFNRDAGVASVELERELTVRKLLDGQGSLFETREKVAETAERIATLRASLASVPNRHTTQVRLADNDQLMERLQSSLLSLEQKRTELLTKYAPGYRLVVEVEQQLEQTRTALATAARSPLRDETTDNNPTHEWIRTELARADAELASLQARERATAATVARYQHEAGVLAERSLEYEELVRQIKTGEDSYLLYLRKQEEARISEALDRQHISNVAITEPVNVSATATSHRALVLGLGILLSLLASLLAAVVVDAWDPTVRTAEELADLLDVPVLATLSGTPLDRRP